MSFDRKKLMSGVRRVVVKVGTSLSFDPIKGIDPRNLEALAAELAKFRQQGLDVVMVTSGAIGAGMHRLKMAARPQAMQDKQATAAVGQAYLMELVAKALARFKLNAGQVLITRQDLESGPRYFNARNTLEALLKMGVVPVINENDTVAVDEINFGGNDVLAAQVCNLVGADLLIILTDVDGLHSSDPRKDPRAKRVSLVTEITKKLQASAGGEGSMLGTGGMVTKILAVRMANSSGEHVVIAKGSKRGVLSAILGGRDEGTLFLAPQLPREKRLRWMPFTEKGLSELCIKPSAIKRVKRLHMPLLPADVAAVKGKFDAGDVVRLADLKGRTWAKAICRLSSKDCLKVKGKDLLQVEKLLGPLPHGELLAFEDIAFRRAL